MTLIAPPTPTATATATATATPTATPTPPPAVSLPTATLYRDNQQAIVPDWASLTFASLPPLVAPPITPPPDDEFEGDQTAKYSSKSPTQATSIGQPLAHVLTLGDVQTSLKLQDLNSTLR